MTHRSQGRKKSNFPAKVSVLAGAFFDYFVNNTNFKISFTDLLSELGATGTLVQDGDPLGTPILDTAGSVNNIRNLENGSGITTSVSPENGAEIAHNFTFNTDGVALVGDPSIASPVFRSIEAGSGINVGLDGDQIQISVTGTPATTKTVVVNELGDFPTPVTGVITLADDTEYLLTNDINAAANRFVFGNNTVLRGGDSAIINLTYTGSGVMFTGTDVTARIDKITITCATGQLLAMTDTGGTAFFQMFDMTVDSCDTIGTVDGMFAVQINNVAFLTVTTDGLSFLNNNTTFIMDTCICVLVAGTFLDLGTATTTNFSVNSCIVTLTGAGTFFVDGLVSSGNVNTGGLAVLQNNRFSGAGTPLNNISPDDAIWQFLINDDIADTRSDALLSMQGNATNTVIAVAGTPVLVAGTWVIERTSQMTGTTAGRITYDGGKDAILPITASLTVEPVSGGSVTLSACVAVDGVVNANSLRTASASAGNPVSITVPWQEVYSTATFTEIFVSNEDTTVDILVSSAVTRVN